MALPEVPAPEVPAPEAPVISKEQVRTVARLSRLSLSEDEVDRMAVELAGILTYVKKLDELDTTGVPPTLQVSVTAAPLRKDERVPGVDKAEVFAEAPRGDEQGFLVPGFVD